MAVVVVGVVAGGRADRAGVLKKDRVVRLNGEPVDQVCQQQQCAARPSCKQSARVGQCMRARMCVGEHVSVRGAHVRAHARACAREWIFLTAVSWR